MILFLELLGIGLAVYAFLAFLGWIPWRLLIDGHLSLPFVVAAPLFGLGILSTFGWYWLEYGSGGLKNGLPVLAGLAVVANAGLLVGLRGRVWVKAPSPRSVVVTALLALFVFAGVAFHYHDGLRGELTAATSGNNDIASYSIFSQAVQVGGYGDRGSVVGNDIGSAATTDSSGAVILLASSAEGLGLRTYQMTIPIVGLGALLVALACASLATRIAPGSSIRSAVIGLAAVAPYLFVFNASAYFLSQILSIAPIVAMLVLYVEIAARHDRASIIRGAAAVALLALSVFLTYFHMALLAQPIILGVALVAQGHRELARRAVRLMACAAVGLGAAALAILPAISGAVERATALADTAAGYPLSLLSPFNMLGFQTSPAMVDGLAPSPTFLRYVVEAALIGFILIGATVVLVRARVSNPWLGGAAALAVFVSYRFMWQAEGYSYQQWKWISFFQPLLSTAMVALVCAATIVVAHRIDVHRNAKVFFGVIAAVIWIGFLTVRAHTLTRLDTWTRVGTELADLEVVASSNLRVVNVDLEWYWETMWGAYFVAPVHSRLVQDSYYLKTKPTARWTVQRATPRVGRGVLAEERINDEYELVCRREPCMLEFGP